MLLKNCQILKSLVSAPFYQFSSPTGPKDTQVMQTKHNPDRKRQLRGYQQNQMHMTQYEKSFLYIHKKTESPFAFYNIFSYLPLGAVKHIAKVVQDPKVQIASDQIYFPKISENSIPVFDSISNNSVLIKLVNKLTASLPFIAIVFSNMPFVMLTSILIQYLLYFKSSFGTLSNRMVIKMQLLPQTEEIVYQKISRLGCITTNKARLNDLQYIEEPQDLVFVRSMRNIVNLKLKFRVKSTGQILMFEKEGIWHQQGLKHELMI